MKHYTLTQCMQLLAVNNRQLKRLLESTSIIPVVASSDRRMLVITDTQLTALKEKLVSEDIVSQSAATPEDTLRHEIELLKQRISELERRAALSPYNRTRATSNIGLIDIEVQEGEPRYETGKEGVSLLPDGYMNLNEFAALHHIPATTLRKAIDSGRLACHHNPSGWKHFRTYVKWAFDPEQQATALALYQQG
jgi:hypothetical protein